MSIRFDPGTKATVSAFGPPKDDESLVGRVLDERFEVRELLGTGSHGAVYDAWDRRHGCAVALKTLLHLAPEELVRFKGEFRVLTDLSHPNLVTPHELFVGRDAAYLTMELVDGTDFLTWVRGEDLDRLYEDRLRDALAQLASGLAALHAFGLLHRDLKPSNVLVRSDGQVLLADFGLAQPLQGGTAGGLFGTPAYMSPEQAADMELTSASDWYSVGVMLFEALTGEYPYGGLSGMGLMMAKQTSSPGRPSKVHPGLPDDLDELCERLLERDPSVRPGPREVLTVLGAVEPLRSRSRAEDEEVFVGRVDELGRLARAWRSVDDRHAAVLFVEGPSGTGKSTLINRFVTSGIEVGTVVLRGRCYERESVPYKGLDVLVDSLRAHLLSNDAYHLAPLSGGAALARVFPVLADVPGVGDQPVIPIEDPLEQRRQAVAALRELLRRLARARPVLMVLDDLQWCDDDTAGVLVELLRSSGRPPLLFVAMVRSEDADRPVLKTLAEHLSPSAGLSVETLELAPLDTERATELARKLLPDGAPAETAETIAKEAEGNPLFVAELVRHARTGADEHHAESLEAVVVERASHLPASARAVLEVVATAERPTPQGVVLAAAGGGGMEAIALLRSQSFVLTHGAAPDDPIEPMHGRIGTALSGSLSADVRRGHHQRLADELERADADAEVIAVHLVAAEQPTRAVRYLDAASVRAMEALAFGRAARLSRSALELVESGDDRRLALQRRLADALAYDGRGVSSAQAYLAAAELAPEEAVLELRRSAAEQLLRCGRLEEGQAELERVLADVSLRVPQTPRAALLGLIALRARIRIRGTQFVERREEDIDPRLLLAIDTTRAAATGLLQSNVMLGQYFQSRHLLLALEGGEPRRLARALAMEALYTATGGTRATVQTDLLNEQISGLSRRLDDPLSHGGAQLAAGVADLYRGRFATAFPRLEQAGAIFRRCTNVHWEMAMVRLFSALSLYYLGDLLVMRRVMDEALRDAADRDDLYTQLMLRGSFEPILHLFDDDLPTARRVFDDLCSRHADPLRTATYRYVVMLTISRIERYAGCPRASWEAFGEHWGAVRSSLMLTKQPFKIFSQHERGLGALAAARVEDGSARRKLLARAKSDAAALHREGTRWSRAMALPLTASLAAQRGDEQAGLDDALAAERAFIEAAMPLYAGTMRIRRGECVGGGEGERLVEEGRTSLVDLGIVAPDKLADMLQPPLRW